MVIDNMQLREMLENFDPQIEQELRQVLAQCGSPLYSLMSYQMGWVDELGEPKAAVVGNRLYAQLCLISANITGDNIEQAIPVAAALELVHNFSLVHDDIRTGRTERYNRPTVWWVWGPAQAINVGDGLHAMGRLAVFRLADLGIAQGQILECLQKLDKSCLELCEGQYLDLTYQERLEVSEEEYLSMARVKTGALFACSLELGVLAGSGDSKMANILGHAGKDLGIAFQIYEDVRNLWPGQEIDRNSYGDLLNKRKSLPVIYGLSQAKGSVKRELGGMYFKRVLEPPDVVQISQLLDELGAREYALRTANGFRQQALENLKNSGLPSDRLKTFEDEVDSLFSR
jgi:geranylgeranyl diphosphate synthase type I